MRVECAIRRGGEVSQICVAAFGLRRDKKVSNDLLRADSLSYFASDSLMRDAKGEGISNLVIVAWINIAD